MSDTFEDWGGRAERAAHNQSLFRSVNEQIKDLNRELGLSSDFGPPPPVREWVCECANSSCMERIPLSQEEYAAVRTNGHRFLIAPDQAHVFPDVEEVTERHETYWVVEKIGAAREISERLYRH
jgi:hypothetical protein